MTQSVDTRLDRAAPVTTRPVIVAHRRGWGTGSLTVAALIAAPWMVDGYTISTMSRMLVLGLLAMSVTLLTGVAGVPTLGQAAYFGVGAYTAAMLGRAGIALGPSQVVAATALAAVAAVATGSVVVRTRGITFLMLTLAVGELAYTAAHTLRVTGGADGLGGIPPVVPLPGMPGLTNDGLVFYYILSVFLLLFVGVSVLVRSPFGLALRGIRDNEGRMRATGYSVYGYLLASHGVAGGVAGAAGALWVSLQRYVAPGDMSFGMAAMALLAAVIGGLGSMRGACVGTALVVLVHDVLGGQQLTVWEHPVSGPLLLGVMFIVVVYLLPGGIAGMRTTARSILRVREPRREAP